MTPSARLQIVIDFLQGYEKSPFPADRALKDFFRTRRFAGSKDRAAVAERVFAILRRRAGFSWRMGTDTPRALVVASMLAEGLSPADIAALFDGSRYGPAPLTEAETAALCAAPAPAPAWVAGEYPPWLEPQLSAAFGADLPAAMAAMGGRAAIDLRVNTLSGSRSALKSALAAEGFAAVETPYSPLGLRLPCGPGTAKLTAGPAFAAGAFEMQDEAAQIAALLCGAKPGMSVLDLAAGAGGKTLALAALMENRGRIVAHDIASSRLHQLETRSTRAGIKIVRTTTAWPSERFDVVLVDAPCSGTGTWRRQPELRWRLDAARLADLIATQDALLDQAAGALEAGGRLIYATCSVLPCENRDRVERFLVRHPDFSIANAAEIWQAETDTPPPPGMGSCLRAAPHTTGTDGFFAAILHHGGSTR
jgi:16S rRNA (cytosine967-C5)-methyltransferase